MQEWISFAKTTNAGSQLPRHSFFLVSPDAKRWCNSMFSNNIRNLPVFQGNRSAICDDRGRMQGLLDIYNLDSDRFLCILDGVDNEWFLNRFNMYMILDDIEQEELQEELFHICGPSAPDVLQGSGFTLPPEGKHYTKDNDIHICKKNRFGIDGFDLITENIDQLKAQLQQNGLNDIPIEGFDALRILHGKAQWPQDGTNKTMIHELNLNEECCSFNKGCYIGQEIINRIDVKGLINKKIQRVAIEGSVTLNDSLTLEGKVVGTVTSLTTVDQQQLGLSVLRKKAWEKGTRLLVSSGGIATVL